VSDLAAPAPPPAAPAPRKRPGWVTAVAIAGIACGAMKALSSLYMMTVGRLLDMEATLLERSSNDVQQVQATTIRELATLSQRFVSDHLPGFLAGVVFGLALVVGGIGCFKLRPTFRVLMLAGFVGVVAVDVGLAPAELQYQRDMVDASSQMMKKTRELTSQLHNGALDAMNSFSETAQKSGYYGVLVWLVLRAGVCAVGFAALVRPKAKALFTPAG
jgi:hypothetical protein